MKKSDAYKKIFKRHVDCSANPLDLRPAADAIMEAVAEKRNAITDENPLVVLMGENHYVASHKALQQTVLSRMLDDQKPFLVNYESQPQLFKAISAKALIITPDLQYRMHTYDPDGDLELSFRLASGTNAEAPFSANNLRAFCFYNRIPLQCSDFIKISQINGILRADTATVDLDHPVASSWAADPAFINKINGRPLKVMSSLGITLRNIIMANHVLQDGRDIVHITGKRHVFSGNNLGSIEDISLHTYYKNRGAHVISVWLDENDVPPEAVIRNTDTVYITGLDAGCFSHKNYPIEGKNISHSLMEEVSHLRAIFAASGGETGLFNDMNRRSMAIHKAYADSLIDKIIPQLPAV